MSKELDSILRDREGISPETSHGHAQLVFDEAVIVSRVNKQPVDVTIDEEGNRSFVYRGQAEGLKPSELLPVTETTLLNQVGKIPNLKNKLIPNSPPTKKEVRAARGERKEEKRRKKQDKLPLEENNRTRQSRNLGRLTGPWRGKLWVDGVPLNGKNDTNA